MQATSRQPLKFLSFALILSVFLTFPLLNSTFYWTSILLAKCLAVTNLMALYSFWRQRKGYRKILEVDKTVEKLHTRSWSQSPSALRLVDPKHSHSAIEWVYFVGFLSCISLFFGFMETLSAILISICYTSLVQIYVPFSGLQMFQQLPETTLVFALGSFFQIFSPYPLIVAQQFFIFRVMLGGGLGKLSGAKWNDLTAMNFHYWSQPLPNPLSRFFYQLPLMIHRWECIGTLAIEGPLAGLQLLPLQLARTFCFILYFGTLAAINLTGNYGHLGWLSVTQCISLLDDNTLSYFFNLHYLERITWWTAFKHLPSSLGFSSQIIGYCLGITLVAPYVLLSLVPFLATFPASLTQRLHKPLNWFQTHCSPVIDPYYHQLAPIFHIGKYVKFAGMTTTRNEVILQVTSRDNPEWRDWDFKYKPGNVDKTPPFIIPGHMPGVDWQCWFLPLRLTRSGSALTWPGWFERMLKLLLQGDKDVVALFRKCPYPVENLKELRVMIFDYRFSFEHQSPRPWAANEKHIPGEQVGSIWWRRQGEQWGITLSARQNFSSDHRSNK